MANEKLMAKKIANILSDYGVYYDADEVLDCKNSYLELVKKASGDSYEIPTEDVFKDDYSELKRLCSALNIALPDEVYYD